MPNPRTHFVPPSDLSPGQWVAIYGPNLSKLTASDFFADDEDLPNPSFCDATINLISPPVLYALTGLPLQVHAVNLPFVILRAISGFRTTATPLIIDTRSISLCPLSSSYVAAYQALATEAIASLKANGPLSTAQPFTVLTDLVPTTNNRNPPSSSDDDDSPPTITIDARPPH